MEVRGQYPTAWARYLRESCDVLGISQAELTERLGMSPAWMDRCIRGTITKPHRKNEARIREAISGMVREHISRMILEPERAQPSA